MSDKLRKATTPTKRKHGSGGSGRLIDSVYGVVRSALILLGINAVKDGHIEH